METKKCTICGEEKNISEFSNYVRSRDGKKPACKICLAEKNRLYFERNREEKLEKNRKYYSKNKDKIKKKNEERRDEILEWHRRYYAENKERFKEYYAQNKDRHAEKRTIYYNLNKKKRSEQSKEWMRSSANFQTHAHKFSFYPDEKVREGADGSLEARCAYCGKWFVPSNQSVLNRIAGLEGRVRSENKFYDSMECKKSCPIYGRSVSYKGEKIGSSREVPADFRIMALEKSDYTCQRCGAKKDGLHVHHIEGYTEQPMLSADIVNVIVVCKDCHRKIHRQPGCRYIDYQCRDKAKAA